MERAVFLLREVLQYEYDEIAEIVGKSSANCRQIFRRAKVAISNLPDHGGETELAKQLKQPAREQATALVEQFVQALINGNVGQLLNIVMADATLYSDGGGKVRAAIRPIFGAERITAFFAGLMAKLPDKFNYFLANVNGETGIVSYSYGQPINVVSFEIRDNRIASFFIVINPDKLRHLPRQMPNKKSQTE
ncbi:sigma factor-like helix-turn-helix DNA-binding protein [Paenibacillus sp. GCM10027628]|uniref:sigma factor-like helix-turn-helix DNA-binding protein n=1 Tax=Paenibacillus sp. GCM10027628 TaxID=3273413 RepID=UPI00363578DC